MQFSLKTERLWDALQDIIIVSLKRNVPLDEPSLTDKNVVFYRIKNIFVFLRNGVA